MRNYRKLKMEGLAMTIARLSDNLYPSFPSFLNRFFEGDMMDWNRSNFAGTNSTLPAVNIRENNNEFMIDVAVPGMKKDQINVDYENGRLTIASEVKEEKVKGSEDSFSRKEFSYSSFQRSFSIPENTVDGEKIKASYNEGILHIILPKRDEIKPKPARQIKIN